MKSSTKIPMKIILKNKHHFQLLELMVAAFILLVCIAPAMRIFTTIYLSEQEMIRENQRDHLAHRLHAKITEGLYKRQYQLEGGTKGASTLVTTSDRDTEALLKKYEYDYEAHIIILNSHKSREEPSPDRYLVKLILELKDISPKARSGNKKKSVKEKPINTFYDYTIYIDAGAGEKNKINDLDDDETDDDDDESGSIALSGKKESVSNQSQMKAQSQLKNSKQRK